MDKKQSFVKGAFILLFANFLVKVIGAVFKIPLTNLIGAEGMGAFSVSYNIYVLMFVISTAGLPVAISKMISESNATHKSSDVPRIIKCAFVIFAFISFVLTVFVLVFAKNIAIWVGNPDSYLSILAISPSIFLITIISILRGYYQGHFDMSKTAISQVIEAIFKLFIGYFFAHYLIMQGYSIEVASAGAIFGVTVGIFLSFCYLVICILFVRNKSVKKPVTSYKNIAKSLFKIAIPITISSAFMSLTSFIDMFTIMNRLQVLDISASLASSMYGAFNMSITLYNLPQAVITSISISLIPVLTSYFASYDYLRARKILHSALNAGMIIAMPCVVSFVIMSKDILNFLYYKRPDDVLMAAPILVILGLAVPFVSIVTITNASMQAIGKPLKPLKAITLGLCLKVALNYILIAIPKVNVSGAAISTVCCFALISIINIYELKNLVGFRIISAKIFIKPIISSIFMGIVLTKVLERFNINDKVVMMATVLVGAVIYFLVLWLIMGKDREDFRFIRVFGAYEK